MDSVKVAKAIRNVKESEKEAKKAEKESKKTADKSLSEIEKIAKSKIKRNNKLDIATGGENLGSPLAPSSGFCGKNIHMIQNIVDL
jgi:hypothetical protein